MKTTKIIWILAIAVFVFVASFFALFGLFNPTQTSMAQKSNGFLADTTMSSATKLTKPKALISSFDYDGQPHTLELDANFNEQLMSVLGELTQTNAGNYGILISLKNTEDYTWDDGTTSPIAIDWKINKIAVAKPELKSGSTSFSYTGFPQKPEFSDESVLDENIMEIVDSDTEDVVLFEDYSKINAKSYSFVVRIKNSKKANYEWADKSTADLTFSWVIKKRTLNVPTLTQSSFLYTGKDIDIKDYLRGFDQETMYLDSYGKKSEVGTYKARIFLKDDKNYEWASGDTIYWWNITSRTNTLPFILITICGTVFGAGVLALSTMLIDPKRRKHQKNK